MGWTFTLFKMVQPWTNSHPTYSSCEVRALSTAEMGGKGYEKKLCFSPVLAGFFSRAICWGKVDLGSQVSSLSPKQASKNGIWMFCLCAVLAPLPHIQLPSKWQSYVTFPYMVATKIHCHTYPALPIQNDCWNQHKRNHCFPQSFPLLFPITPEGGPSTTGPRGGNLY